jgi:hypothetical protein
MCQYLRSLRSHTDREEGKCGEEAQDQTKGRRLGNEVLRYLWTTLLASVFEGQAKGPYFGEPAEAGLPVLCHYPQ